MPHVQVPQSSNHDVLSLSAKDTCGLRLSLIRGLSKSDSAPFPKGDKGYEGRGPGVDIRENGEHGKRKKVSRHAHAPRKKVEHSCTCTKEESEAFMHMH